MYYVNYWVVGCRRLEGIKIGNRNSLLQRSGQPSVVGDCLNWDLWDSGISRIGRVGIRSSPYRGKVLDVRVCAEDTYARGVQTGIRTCNKSHDYKRVRSRESEFPPTGELVGIRSSFYRAGAVRNRADSMGRLVFGGRS